MTHSPGNEASEQQAAEWLATPPVIVAIGAAAGGVKALQDFFAQVPAHTGAAYVVILDLPPDHERHLAEALQATAGQPVTQVSERVTMQPDHVYVIPPAASLSIDGDHLVLSEVTRIEEPHARVDIFFRTLADTAGSRVAAVVLSGTGSDGISGLKRVKEHGGLTIAQDPAEADHGDMPTQAIAAGLVDYVLPVAQMPAAIFGYYDRLTRLAATAASAARPDNDADALKDILALLRVRTGHDFSNYKPPTMMRRIARRMNLRSLSTVAAYAQFIREEPAEAEALMKELLISVTNFFRDPEAFAALERQVIPRLFQGKHGDEQVRVWVAGCATGEEAYSIAMLVAEAADTHFDPPSIQLFATDLDEHAIAAAREGVYTEADVADLSAERLQRFLQREPGGFRVRPELRELVLFATHNVITDPPFSHLDLVSCRNLLIYLNRASQDRILETFQFALRPGGYLFLGTSENADGGASFAALDRAAHIYESRSMADRPPSVNQPAGLAPPRAMSRPAELGTAARTLPAELHHRLLEQYAPPSVVVTEDFVIRHVSQHAGRYLEVPGGEPSRDLLRLARPELRADLRNALAEAKRQRTTVAVRGVRLASGGADQRVTITVRPALRDGDPPSGFLLVLFEDEVSTPGTAAPVEIPTPVSSAADDVEEELAAVRSQLRATIEQYETQVEVVSASNEELQAANEELRSSAEEIETSKDELQALNEQLTRVNQELKVKVEELAITNDHFRNFINSTDIGTIFLDRAMRVTLFTRRAREVFNLRPSDTGRLLRDITHTLIYDRLQEDVKRVLDRLQTVEREVQSRDRRWYLLRMFPYRTTDDRIEGVVLTLLDITMRWEADMRVKVSEERLRLLIESAVDYAIFSITADGRIDSWNAGAQRMFGYAADEIVGTPAAILFTPEDRAAGVPEEELRCAARDGRASDERYHLRRDGVRFYCSGVTTRLGEGQFLGFAKIARDLTAQRESELALQRAYGTLEDRVQQRTRELREEIHRRTTAQEHATNLLRKLVTAQEDQRARIARDLHDQLGQQLTALRLTLERYRDRARAGAAADDDMDRALGLARELDSEVDFLAWELRPAVLDDLGLPAALPRFLQEWSAHYGIAAEFRSAGVVAGQLSRESEVTFYRIAQEALNNVAKHAHASRVDVILEGRDGSVVLVIEDDGVGFDPTERETVARGIGLVGMRERAALSGAALDIESAPGEGTTVFVRTAVKPERTEAAS